jgi:tetratricopeptide (TPR) repeat protein
MKLPSHLQLKYDLCGQYMINGEAGKAIPIYLELLNECPENFSLLLSFGNALNCVQMNNEAKLYLLKALSFAKSTADMGMVHYGLGWAYGKLGDKITGLQHLSIAKNHSTDKRLLQEIEMLTIQIR